MSAGGGPERRAAPREGRARRDAESGSRRRPKAIAEALALPGAGAWFVLLWAAVLLLAPPASNWFWGVNGFRSLPAGFQLGLLAFALACGALAALRVRSTAVAAVLGVALAAVLAFVLHERTHFLGDTQIRLRAMAVFSARMISVSLNEWSTRMHANPLDIVVNFLGPIGGRRLGLSISQSVSLFSLLLALVFFTGVWRISGRLGAPAGLRIAVCAALALAGTLEVFAGYAESSGLLLATAAWWWSEMLAPLAGRAQAFRTAAAWLIMFLAHRLALVMLLPLAWRALGPPLPGDEPAARRWMIGSAAAAAAIAGVALMLGAGGRQLGTDTKDLLPVMLGAILAVPPSDVLNVLALVAPLAFLAPWLAGRAALGEFFARPEAKLLLTAAIPLVPLVWIIPAGANALGAHRDFDLGTLAGFTLTIMAVMLLTQLPAARLRGALLCALPVVALQAGGWVAVNANEEAATLRAKALAEKPPGLAAPHLSHLHVYLGQRAMDLGAPQFAAPEFDLAFKLNPNPRRALMAAEAWARSGDLVAARSAMARGRAAGPLSPSLTIAGRRLDALIDQLTADSARAAGGDSTRAATHPAARP